MARLYSIRLPIAKAAPIGPPPYPGKSVFVERMVGNRCDGRMRLRIIWNVGRALFGRPERRLSFSVSSGPPQPYYQMKGDREGDNENHRLHDFFFGGSISSRSV